LYGKHENYRFPWIKNEDNRGYVGDQCIVTQIAWRPCQKLREKLSKPFGARQIRLRTSLQKNKRW
jgi:hypothetical protein